MNAKWPGMCPKCQCRIQVGDPIRRQGPKFVHADCGGRVVTWGHERDVWTYVLGHGMVCEQTGEVIR